MKLKSRKFWLAVVVIAYAAIMGIRALNIESNTIVTIVCVAAAAVAGIAYVIAEAMVDETREEIEDDGEAEG